MYQLEKHPYFEKFTDPKTGVESFVLTRRIGKMQQHFYFSQPSVTKDGKYLWIRCSFPPAKYQSLAVVSLDPDDPFIRHFPHAAIAGGNGCLPCLTPQGDGAIFGIEDTVYKVDTEGTVTPLITMDPGFVKHRPIERLFTHASVSCDGRYLVMDTRISDKYYLCLGDLETGEVKVINNFGRCYNHGLFSPTKPDIMLVDQDWWRDYHTGEYFPIDNRMWLMNTAGTYFEPVIPNMFYGRDGTAIAHDFWSGDGLLCWNDYCKGTFECDIDTRETTHVWKRPLCHAHASHDRQMWCADQSPYTWAEKPCQMLFYDRQTNREIEIFSAMPYPVVPRASYHHDPHPQFAAEDRYIVSTTTVLGGEVNVAITPVAPLLQLCRQKGTVVEPVEEIPGDYSYDPNR